MDRKNKNSTLFSFIFILLMISNVQSVSCLKLMGLGDFIELSSILLLIILGTLFLLAGIGYITRPKETDSNQL